MNTYQLGRCLGDITSPAFQRFYFRQNLESLEHHVQSRFDSLKPQSEESASSTLQIAHRAGTNCIAVDQTLGRYLVSGGADTAIKLWDLQQSEETIGEVAGISARRANETDGSPEFRQIGEPETSITYHPLSSTSKAMPNAHTHSITSLSIYPFDPTPTTLLTTSYDQSLLLTQITPTALQPLHKFALDFTAHTHAVSPIASSPLAAVGTSHPAPRLIDLRSALATHSLPGHTAAVYSLAWHLTREHTLVSSSADGRILAFDIRRATPAFAAFDVDDSVGVVDSNRPVLDYAARAHGGPITGIIFSHDGRKLISASQDQRIRVWDVASGRNDLVHFGPRIRNSRDGELRPVLPPQGTCKPGQEVLFWPNDDGRGEIFMHEVREGTLLRVLKTKNVVQVANAQKSKGGRSGRAAGGVAVSRLTSGGRINSLAFRPVASDEGLGGALEMYSAHGDGRICAWLPSVPGNQDEDEVDGDAVGRDSGEEEDKDARKTQEELDAEKSRKRKRDLIEGLVQGLNKKPVTFS